MVYKDIRLKMYFEKLHYYQETVFTAGILEKYPNFFMQEDPDWWASYWGINGNLFAYLSLRPREVYPLTTCNDFFKRGTNEENM